MNNATKDALYIPFDIWLSLSLFNDGAYMLDNDISLVLKDRNVMRTLVMAEIEIWFVSMAKSILIPRLQRWIQNFNGEDVEVLEWISYFIQHFTGHVITYPWDQS